MLEMGSKCAAARRDRLAVVSAGWSERTAGSGNGQVAAGVGGKPYSDGWDGRCKATVLGVEGGGLMNKQRTL